MPAIDVTDNLFDPDFCELLEIERRVEIIGQNGRATRQKSIVSPAPAGVVTTASGDKRIVGSDTQFRTNSIRVASIFRLRGPGPGVDPDIVIWHGNRYVVVQVDDNSNFGLGFTNALCTSVETEDVPPGAAT
jgi:hypothetical protein